MNVITADEHHGLEEAFFGLRLKKDPAGNATVCPVSPIFENWYDTIFFSFGYDWLYRDYLLPAYYLPGRQSGEQEFAYKIRLSVEDRRRNRKLTFWTNWQGCESTTETLCGQGHKRYRTRECECPETQSNDPNECFPEEDCSSRVSLYEEEDCPQVDNCAFGNFTDFGNCVYHSECCTTLRVKTY